MEVSKLMQREMKWRLFRVATTCAICGLAVAPALAQSDKMAPETTGTPSNSSQYNSTGEMKGHDRSMKNHDSATDTGSAKMSDQSSRVRRAQEALKSEGHDPGPIDGVMGPKTQEALRQYQKQENLKQTGRLDQDTMSKLGVSS